MKKIISFDIGHTNMAMVCATISPKKHKIRVTHTHMFNLQTVVCNDPNCIFMQNDRLAGHLTYHLVEKIKSHLKRADFVITEQQPLCGMNDIEQCLMVNIKNRFTFDSPDNIRTLSPRTMHSYFKINHLSKEQRSKRIIQIAKPYLNKQSSYRSTKTKEHLSDACAFIIYFTDVLFPSLLKK